MTSENFVTWLRGFTEGCHEYQPTPKQWDLLKEKLAEVENEKRVGTPVGVGGWGTPNHDLVNRTSGYLSASYIGSTTATYPSGTTVTYTTNGGPTWYRTTGASEMLSDYISTKIENNSGNK